MTTTAGSRRGRKRRVLVADDDEAFLAVEAAVLASEGYEVCAVRSGAEAMAALESFDPDLVVLDILLPDLPGFADDEEMLRRADIPVVLISVLPSGGESFLRGASAFVQKPAAPEQLLATVRSTVGEPGAEAAILVVDDDDASREFYRTVLELKTPFRVVEAANGREALDRLAAEPAVRLVVTDVHMPVMNGVELVRALRREARWRELPVIVQTSDALMARSNVWTELNVERALEKDDFRTWLRQTVARRVGVPTPEALRLPRPPVA